MIKAEWTNADALDLQPTCNQIATDLISRQAVIDALTHKWDGMVTSVFDVLKELPSAQPERKKGEWTIDEDCEGKSRTVTCNLCGYEEFNWHNPNFCPNCGADMRNESDAD